MLADFGDTMNSDSLEEEPTADSKAFYTKRLRQAEEEHARKEAHDSHLAKEYAQKMFDWGKVVLSQNHAMRKFMESVAVQIGMPAALVPPLPPHPGFCVSTSQNQSPEKCCYTWLCCSRGSVG